MKALLTVFSAIMFAAFSLTTANASTSVSNEEAKEFMLKKMGADASNAALTAETTDATKMTKAEKRAAKRLKKLEKFASKFFDGGDGVDFSDPVDKWMWFWIFGWGIAIVFSVIPGLWYIGSLFGLAGTVCLVIWLVKKFG